MEYKNSELRKLNDFIKENKHLIMQLINKEIVDIDDFEIELKNSKARDRKLYSITKDISKIIDLYDENNKVKLNRDIFIQKFYMPLINEYVPKEKHEDYKDVIDIMIGETVQYDKDSWEVIYDKVLEVVNDGEKNDKIDLNKIYDIDHTQLIPIKQVNALKNYANDKMIEGGIFSFESNTQEMVGILNEFIILKGKIAVKMYLEQGAKSNIKIEELLKEVNAASLVEPFYFGGEAPQFKRASAGQFDGFILHRDQAKVILATKSENTHIENDSLFRHFVTALVIKKKIDETIPSQTDVNRKTMKWINYYSEDKNFIKAFRKHQKTIRQIKKDKNIKLNSSDYFVGTSVIENLEMIIERVKLRNGKLVNLPINLITERHNVFNQESMEKELLETFFNKEIKQNKKGISLSVDNATILLNALKENENKQKEFKEDYMDFIYEKIESKKFADQIYLDVKKATMVMNNQYLSIKDMISYYNKHPKSALKELNIFNQSNEISNVSEFGVCEMDKLKELAQEHNVELIYFGSVSAKKSSQEYEYDKRDVSVALKNKEYRYGLNLLAYANELSAASKDSFKIAPDAALEFVELVSLRAETNKTKEFGLDLYKINKENFIKEIISTTYDSFYNKKIVENDSIPFWENLINSSNVLFAEIIMNYELDKEDNPNITIEESFNQSMKYRTGNKTKEFNLYNTIDSLKFHIEKNSKKLNQNVGILDSLDLRLNKVIQESNDPKTKDLLNKFKTNSSLENKKARLNRRRTI